MCLRDKLQVVEETIAFLEYIIKINDGPEKTELLEKLKQATYSKHKLNDEILEMQLAGTV